MFKAVKHPKLVRLLLQRGTEVLASEANSQKALFCFLVTAINDSCLVFDGKLVVDADFHTNDPCIRAAGSLTKFQRRYHAQSWLVGITSPISRFSLFPFSLWCENWDEEW